MTWLTPAGADAARGARAIAPLLLGAAPFGLVAGVAGPVNGASTVETVGFSLVSFAGAAQIAAMDLLGRGTAVWVVLLTMVAINLRFVLYSAGLAPWLRAEPLPRRALGAYLLTDHAYVVSTARFLRPPAVRHPGNYYLGAALAFWVTWQVATLVGAIVGRELPASVPLTFAAPLTFLALLIPQLTSWPIVAAAGTAGLVAVAGSEAPANLGMLLGCVSGIAVGSLAHGVRGARR